MQVHATSLPGVLIVEPKVFGDHRGFFLETYSESRYQAAGIEGRFVQDNMSSSTRGILRGLHYQVERPQAKLVSVVEGEIFDVAVDIRTGSPNYGKWVGVKLDATTRKQLFVPAGFAHGFLVLSERALVSYKCTEYYEPKSEGGIIWNCPEIGVEWPLDVAPVLSAKDAAYPSLSKARK
ncbi:MAG: dTDP-4-dehydrorhamnose 3,5-epimerase [Myxococcota bacterium]